MHTAVVINTTVISDIVHVTLSAKCLIHATVASITVNSRPLKEPWQCIY